jgi:hypothetical protein
MPLYAMLAHMRTSFDIPDHLFRLLKQRALADGLAMREIMLRALQAHLSGSPPFEFRWRISAGRQLVPDELLDDRSKLGEYLTRGAADDRH